jgi:hypothetical protein
MPLVPFALPALLQSDDSNRLSTVVAVFFVTCAFALTVIVIAGLWKTFVKAGQPGWGALIPIYNAYLLTQIARRPGWWVLLMFIPLVNIVISVIISVAIGENFGKGAGFGIGLFILPFIFYPILGFGEATYRN